MATANAPEAPAGRRRESSPGPLRKILRKIYREFDVVITVIDLDDWTPRLERFWPGMRAVELTADNLARYEPLLAAEKRREIVEGLQRDWRVFAVIKGDDVAGTVGGSRSDRLFGVSYEAAESELILHHLHVKPAYRKKATAGVVAELTFAALRDDGVRRIYGTISSKHPTSLIFAQHLGWKQLERHRVRRLFAVLHFGQRRVEGLRDEFAPRRSRR